ncbi:hypothetical protein TNCV_3146561 [Trichonephila clavipes]|nr:hypothetical protein TNCV_3146561 [Trichonephila clavipes]
MIDGVASEVKRLSGGVTSSLSVLMDGLSVVVGPVVLRKFWQRTRCPSIYSQFRTLSREIAKDIQAYSRVQWEKHIEALSPVDNTLWRKSSLLLPVPETGRTSSSELIKNRAELDESDIRVNKIETKDGQDKSCWKNSSGRSPLTDERIALQAAVGLTPVTIFGQPVPWVNVAKYLGLFLDAKLTFAYHIEQTRKKRSLFMPCLKGLSPEGANLRSGTKFCSTNPSFDRSCATDHKFF